MTREGAGAGSQQSEYTGRTPGTGWFQESTQLFRVTVSNGVSLLLTLRPLLGLGGAGRAEATDHVTGTCYRL